MSSERENTVLVVNDSPDQLDLMSVLLLQAGYRVLTARDGLEAFQTAQREPPALVISDVTMPYTDGIELCRLMRADHELRDVPVLLVSALRKDTESIVEGFEAGAEDYLESPFDPMRLIAKVARLIERTRLEATVRRSALEWRLTFDAIEFPVLILDPAGIVIQLNRAAKEISGKAGEEVAGLGVECLGAGEPWRKAAELVGRVRETRSAISGQARDESNGKTWDITANPVSGPGIDVERIVLVAHDITQTVEMQASLRRSETLSMMGSLVAGVAHEVRNPLFGISSTLDAFEARLGPQKEYQRYTSVLRRELDRLNELMQELLDYGKPPTLEFYHGSIVETIAQAVRSCEPLAEKSRVKIVNRITSVFAPVPMDRRRMPQVFLNLLENAIYHSPPEGVVTIEAEEVEEDGQRWVECAIKDCGPGFRAEDLPRIFEPFFTRRRKGSGLGLSIVQRIVEEHRGRITVGNRPEGGAVVTVRFPLAVTD